SRRSTAVGPRPASSVRPSDRDWAVRDYRNALKDARRAPATINAALAALDDFYRFLGLGAARKVRRDSVPQGAPRALSEEQLRRLLRALECPGRVRDRAAAALMVFAGLRVAEVASLDAADVSLTARTGAARVRRGKGDAERVVPLPAEARAALAAWLAIRPGESGPALFPSPGGAERLSVRALHRGIAGAGRAAGLSTSPHALRHTYITRLVRRGVDLPTVAELAGHRRLETTRRYSRPSDADRQAAVELLELDF
ncbi:MAG: tyrosine-type recombinase/integrase, partial [Solirubrobacteraceae bacterium]